MLKSQKIEFVNKVKKEIKEHKTIGIMSIERMPDRLFQKIRNEAKEKKIKTIVSRKNLLLKILDQENVKNLTPFVNGNVAIFITNDSPFELFNLVSSNKIRLIAKPNQLADSDIVIEPGETSLQPGQAVTELKTAGIDVQIQKGKVTIGKSKTLVKKGEKISLQVSKALKLLDILPFEAKGNVVAIVEGKLLYTPDVLKVNKDFVNIEIGKIFNSAYLVSLELGIVTQYNVEEFIRRAFVSALAVGTKAQIPEGEVIPRLMGIAFSTAKNLDGMVKKE